MSRGRNRAEKLNVPVSTTAALCNKSDSNSHGLLDDPSRRTRNMSVEEPMNPRVQMTYFMDRIMGLARLSLQGQNLVLAPLQGSPRTFVAVTDRLWRDVKQPAPTLALISDTRDGRFVQTNGPMFAIVPAWEA